MSFLYAYGFMIQSLNTDITSSIFPKLVGEEKETKYFCIYKVFYVTNTAFFKTLEQKWWRTIKYLMYDRVCNVSLILILIAKGVILRQ